ncbi:MAG: glycosyltransferase [Syntrophaceae bacterium]|nr:MAG: glycosyltransferase [Syntrophaceae bacterium]
MKPSVYKLGRFLLWSATDEKQAANAWPAGADTGKSAGRPSSFFSKISSDYLLVLDSTTDVSCDQQSLRRLLAIARDTGAGIIYSDFLRRDGDDISAHPLNDHQEGSIRDDFSFGYFFIISAAAIKTVLQKYGMPPHDASTALYDLRLKISIDHALIHVPEFLYTVSAKKIKPAKSSGRQTEEQFAYVAEENFVRQQKMEKIATNYLKQIGAHLPARTKRTDKEPEAFQWKASIVIPVLNRKKTITDALTSALGQQTDFPFNILVVDNHSTDGTTNILKRFAAKYPHIQHIIPSRHDLGIGGCWNEAICSPHCGRYIIQLDSDDLYSSPQTLQKIVTTLRRGQYAMVVGSYTLVDEKLKSIPPGLIDHREWTPQNGHNNLLRVNGMGAPRAFDAAVIRQIGFPNVSYGEDYAVALRLTREYAIGRIYESLYLCRRWRDNTDAGLSEEKQNHNDYYKDKLRTIEIQTRQQINEKEKSTQNINDKNHKECRHSRAGGNPEFLNTGFRVALRLPGMTNEAVTAPPQTADRQTGSSASLAPNQIFAEFPGKDDKTLPQICHNFFKSQKKSWPALASACRDLTGTKIRKLSCGNYSITLQYNPARALSSGAAVDAKSIKKRPCFLCRGNLPPGQHGILYRNRYLILCNPAPIFDRHFTVVTLKHQPQDIMASLSWLLQIAKDASPDYTVLYNGPACGASAPDHLHFQMIPSDTLPFLKELNELPPIKVGATVQIFAGKGFDRAVVVLASEDTEALKEQFIHLLKSAQEVFTINDEPPVNVFCDHDKGCLRLTVFLRRKHRPDAYYAESEDRIFVSPGAIDIAGVIITPLLKDFEKLNCDTMRKIYQEVSPDEETLEKIISSIRTC